MGGWVDGHFDIFFDILLKPPQPFTGLFFNLQVANSLSLELWVSSLSEYKNENGFDLFWVIVKVDVKPPTDLTVNSVQTFYSWDSLKWSQNCVIELELNWIDKCVFGQDWPEYS